LRINQANFPGVMVVTSYAGVAGSVRRVNQDAETNSAREMFMKYAAMLIAVVLAFIAGTQISSANGFHKIHSSMAAHSQTVLVNHMASEWLIPDNANRMLAYHKAWMQ